MQNHPVHCLKLVHVYAIRVPDKPCIVYMSNFVAQMLDIVIKVFLVELTV